MLTNIINWIKPKTTPEPTPETEENLLIQHAIYNNNIPINEQDYILFDTGLAGYGIYGHRQEALVINKTTTDAKVTFILKSSTTKRTRWVPRYAITSNLGKEYKTRQELSEMGLIDPIPPKAPNKPLTTGTYILQSEDNYYLVEIEKANETYYIHNTNDSTCYEIKQDHNYNLHDFSTPENGTYILDPGLYINTDQKLYEVIPFKGKSWTRLHTSHTLYELTPELALTLTRIETDEHPGFYIIDNTDEEPQEHDDYLQPYKPPT